MTFHDQDNLRNLPAVHELVDQVLRHELDGGASRSAVTDAARQVIQSQRQLLRTEGRQGSADLAQQVARRLEDQRRAILPAVINATGIIVHTGLGRAPLSQAAVHAVAEAAGHYAPVELDLPSGDRGQRSGLIRELLQQLTGAESGTVVNNNAAALVVTLAALARGRAVVVSRGELIEIGGSFRLPDVMQAGGAILREVGTTNRTRLNDYRRAIDADTAALLQVHTSNYRVEGFTESVPLEELVRLGHEYEIPVICDTGSGLLCPRPDHPELAHEPDAATCIAAGVDVVMFSGDKLLGGPQAGIIVGKRRYIDGIERHPLMRAMRVDKITLAGLGATLQAHQAQSQSELPIWAALQTSVEELRRRAEAVAGQVRGLDAAVVESTAYAGGGSVPTQAVVSVAVTLRSDELTDNELARRLRMGDPPVVSRVHQGAVWLDMRTVGVHEDDRLVQAIERLV
jgi:L-seryl-tRNA(Ser) seleniumtransferase